MINQYKFSTKSILNTLIHSMRFTKVMNVHISNSGSKLLNNAYMAAAVLDKVIIDHKKLDNGGNIIIEDKFSNKVVEVSTVVTTLEEDNTVK